MVELDGTFDEITVVTESASYGGTSYPQLIVEAHPALVVTQQTATATDASGQTLTVRPFTPTALGVVELRLTRRWALFMGNPRTRDTSDA